MPGTNSTVFERGGAPLPVRVAHEVDGTVRATIGDATLDLRVRPLPDGGVRLEQADGVHVGYAVARGRRIQVRLDGRTFDLAIAQARGRAAGGSGTGVIEAPMTGTVLDVRVAVGDTVAADQPVVVLNAMKMEHKLVAGVAGTVREVACGAGRTVEAGAVLVRIEPGPDA